MKMKQQIWASGAAVLAGAVMVSAQPPADTFYQLNGKNITVVNSVGSTVVKGKPFSATEEQHFLQVLGDGTRIETKQTTRLYRDGEGRVRSEDVTGGTKTQPGFEFGPITIVDPVANTRTAINPQTREKMTVPSSAPGRTMFVINTRDLVEGAAGNGTFTGTVRSMPLTGQKGKQALPAAEPKSGDIVVSNGGAKRQVTEQLTTVPIENLGMKNVNGVMARGERTVTVISAAEIGANRDIRVVNERWYSDDLQLLIKSTNTDPRFGDTTYELTGITLGEQSPSLFEIPADYTEATGGRGRGGAAPGGRGGGGGRGTTK